MGLETRRDPARSGYAITPDDNTTIRETRAIYVATGGDINVLFANDTSPVVMKNVPGGVQLPWAVKKVLSTSTTASDIVGLA